MSKRIVNNVVKSYIYERVLKNGKKTSYIQLVWYTNNIKNVETHSLTNAHDVDRYVKQLVEDKQFEISKHKFSEWFGYFMNYKKSSVDIVTYGSYTTRSLAILRYFGDRYVEDIHSNDINQFFLYMLHDGNTIRGGGLAYQTVLDHKMLLSNFYNYLIGLCNIEGIVNVVRAVKVPHISEDEFNKEQPYMNKDEADKFIEYVHNHKIYNKYELAFKMTLTYGFRRSELLGLKWTSIDFDENELRIENTVVRYNRKTYYKSKTKNKSSKRGYPLLPSFKDKLLALKENSESEYVFNYDPDSVSKAFKKCIRNAGLNKKLHFHSLRHSCVCIMAESGKDWQFIRNWIGHSGNSKTLENVYLHVTDKLRKQSTEDIEKIFM